MALTLRGDVAAVDDDLLGGDVARFVGQQEADDAADLLGIADPFQQNVCQ